ncbi:hypothetical protein GPJ56_008133 [Histomonas meleagridis]|uniref:uncharacterized protein n=1 Tax=Histomonas meleagridis TaxID=135588 RepID=UPI0035599854|nr:hypothetical protein GPJ56_008133 [Histomonas meleagridis]KAH0803127.1 hypothetical protein GO595_004220 [Histomonas meleagridis]
MSTASHIPVFRKSSLFPNANLNDSSPENFSFSSAFEHLETLITKCKTKVIAITDFCLLYPSLILSINQNSSESALHFLNEFLELKSTRSQEANILFAVLINLYNSFSDEKELVVSVLGKLAQLEDCICTRLQNGAKHQDENLSSLCIKVLTKIGIQIKDSGTQFSNISENSDEKEAIQILSEYVEALENNGQPSDISDFMMNIVTVMQRFNDSAVVLVHAATCAEAVLPFYTEASVEVVYHCISICASILSGETFLNGDKSFEASEAIQNLFNELFQNISPEILRKSIEANVAESNDMKLKPILEQLHMIKCDNSEEFIKPIIDSLEIFHPKYELPQFLMKLKKKKSFELLQESIQRLTNPETVFEEIEEVTCKSVDGDFGNYPKHLLVMLQTSWIIKTRKIPPNCDENMYNDVMNSIQKIMKMSDDEIDESEFGYKANTERYQQIVSC